MDSNDWGCPNASCVLDTVKGQLPSLHGVVLLHSVKEVTASALADLVDWLRSHDYQLWTVEQVLLQSSSFGWSRHPSVVCEQLVKARFGMTSAQLFGAPAGRAVSRAFLCELTVFGLRFAAQTAFRALLAR
jgi:hypothetical protein